MIYLTSDLHLNHDRNFIWGPRGFNNVWEMNDAIVKNWNSIITMEDDVYLLGDIMLGDNEVGLKLFKQLKGNIHIIWGNHDTDNRKELFNNCYNVVETGYANMIHYNGYHFFLSHYPCLTGNGDKFLKQCTINLSGHTHSKEKFYSEQPLIYNVAVDAHRCMPVSIDSIIEDMIINYRAINNH